MNINNTNKIAITSFATFGGIWLILETMSYFGLNIIKDTGPLGFLWLLTASIVIALMIFAFQQAKQHNLAKERNSLSDEDNLIYKVFKNKRDAVDDIRESVNQSTFVKILDGRGNELQRETYSKIFESPQKFSSIKILLPNPEPKQDSINWLVQREKELITFDKTYSEGTLIDQVKLNNKFVLNMQNKFSNFELRLCNIPHIGMITVTDNSVFFYFLKSNGHGRDSKMYQSKLGSEFYNYFNRYFDEVWNGSKAS